MVILGLLPFGRNDRRKSQSCANRLQVLPGNRHMGEEPVQLLTGLIRLSRAAS